MHVRTIKLETADIGANSDVHASDFANDVALSFAGEEKAYVQKIAAALRRRGVRPFYDDEKAILWSKDLYECRLEYWVDVR